MTDRTAEICVSQLSEHKWNPVIANEAVTVDLNDDCNADADSECTAT
jgi:hypothetical protein